MNNRNLEVSGFKAKSYCKYVCIGEIRVRWYARVAWQKLKKVSFGLKRGLIYRETGFEVDLKMGKGPQAKECGQPLEVGKLRKQIVSCSLQKVTQLPMP